ncbi:MAG: SIMPL domain-containing protein [Candidatus Pacearchaeota archaeon]
MEKSVKISLIVSLTLIIIAVLMVFTFLQIKNPQKSTISSTGEAEISVIPDKVVIYLNIETNGSSSKEANEKNSKIYNDLTNNLEKIGIKKEEIKTAGFNIFEDVDWTQYGRKSRGWKAVHSLEIRLNSNESEKIGKAIDEAINSGANISWINFELSKDLEIKTKAEVIKLASQDARARAEALVSGQGRKLGKLISIEESFSYYPWRFFDMVAFEGLSKESVVAEAKANINPSERKINVRVKAVYEVR